MSDDAGFLSLNETKQNELLRMVASLLRPVIGEIGEAVVEVENFKVNDRNVTKKPGFLGLVFQHGSKVIVFAEYVDEDDRKQYRDEQTNAAAHVFSASLPYVVAIVDAAKKSTNQGLSASDALEVADVSHGDLLVKEIFRVAYGNEVDASSFKIRLSAKLLEHSGGSPVSLIYFAMKDGQEIKIGSGVLKSLTKLIEQLVRNALGLAGISDQRLRSTVGYLLSMLPNNFNDYIYPETLAAIYAYVREVVPLPLAGSNLKYPIVSGHPDDDKGRELAQRLKSLHHAKEVQVNRAVGGSLQGASVYSLTVKTATHGSNEETSYSAIAKFNTIKEARDESEGLRKLQRYYSKIGTMLPPPLEVYLELKAGTGFANLDKKDWLKTKCISLTPDLEGEVLSEKITEHWASPTRRVERFSGYLAQAQEFIKEIQNQPIENASLGMPAEESYFTGLEEFIAEVKKSGHEASCYILLTNSLSFPDAAWLELSSSGVDTNKFVVPNPIRWIRKMLATEPFAEWKKDLPKRRPASVLIHGDFHTGNLFLSRAFDELTVLDYDCVGSGPPEEDFARLDASFVSFVFALPDFRTKGNWSQFAPDALALAAGLHPKTVVTLERNSFARDLSEVLEIIRPAGLSQFYCASVAKALLIQLKMTCTTWLDDRYVLADEKVLQEDQGRIGATWLYLAFMLSRLLEPKAESESVVVWDPFKSAIKQSSAC